MTVFERLMAGEIPCYVVYEDADVFAFLDAEPVAQGHTLLVPRRPVATLDALRDDEAAALGRTLPRLCRAVMRATGARAYNVLQNNGALAHQAVPHVHFHIIPRRNQSEGLEVQWATRPLDRGPAAEARARAIGAAMHNADAGGPTG